MSDKITKEPAIRFNGFSGPWEQRKLETVVNVQSGKDYKHLNEGSIPVYGTGGYMLSVSDALSYDKDAIGIGRKGTINKPFILKAPFWTVDTLFYVVPKGKYDLDFIYGIFQKVDWKKKDESTGVPSLSKSIINMVNIMVTEYDEQNRIGIFFKKLDNLITLQQCELDLMKKEKQTLLSKMFPKTGEQFPEIRFKEFTDPWEQRKLGEVAKYRNGKAHENNITAHGRYTVINSKFVSTNGIVQKFSDEQIEPLYKNEIAFVLSDVPNGRAIARTYLVENDDLYTLNQRIAGITPLKYTYPYFIYIVMNRNKYFLKFDDGSKQTNLTLNDVLNFETGYPELGEQKKIGSFFKQLDTAITLQQRKLDQMKTMKKSLLKAMFI